MRPTKLKRVLRNFPFDVDYCLAPFMITRIRYAWTEGTGYSKSEFSIRYRDYYIFGFRFLRIQESEVG